MNVDSSRVQEAVARAREGEADRAFLRGGSAAVGIQPSRQGAIESRSFVQDYDRGAGIHHQFTLPAID
jgi:hypothetical protein